MEHRKEITGLLLFLLAMQVQGDCLVNTVLGTMRGTEMTSRGGRQFCSYRAIPFAKPPVGPLRLKAPVPVSSWTGELDATADGPQCIQLAMMSGDVVGQEDCLYMNVYTPQMSEPLNQPLPVLFFIHGGRFEIGSGISSMYGPQFLLDKDIILVTTNYRLGALGLLTSGDDDVPGNFAFKDQSTAMRWVQTNIAQFGGDPDKVTIQGESAGSLSVHVHMLSPYSSGLFRAAISESGSALMGEMLPPDDPLPKARLQAEAVNCPTDNTTLMFNCFREVDAALLVKNPLANLWAPAVEKQTASNSEPFLTATPLDIILSGDFAKIPWLMGLNAQEGIMFVPNDILLQSGLDNLNKNFDSLATSSLFMDCSLNDSLIAPTWDRIADFYFGDNHTITLDNVERFIEIFTDRFMTHPIHRANLLHTRAGEYPIFKYDFDYRGKNYATHIQNSDNVTVDLGVGHADELFYLFDMGLNEEWPEGHPDLEAVDALITLWTNFVIYGNPTPVDGDIPQDVLWAPINSSDEHVAYLKFGQAEPPTPPLYDVMPLKISMEQDLYKQRVDFWDTLPLKENQGQTHHN